MKAEIRRYLDEHGATYTAQALREGLLAAGYDPDEVSAALNEWASERAQSHRPNEDRRSFRTWSLLIYLGALAAVFLATVFVIGTEVGLAAIGAAVLLLFLLVAWAVSALLGRWVLPRMGFSVALAIPLVLAVGLGGTCLALMRGMTPVRPTSGSVELHIDPPLSFTGSGAAGCFVELDGRSSSFHAENLGTFQGRTVSLSVDYFVVSSEPAASSEPVSGPDAPSIFISFNPASETERGFGYTSTSSSRLAFENAADGLSGTVTFEGLAPEPGGEPGAIPTEPISGTISWTCEARS